MTIDHVIPRSRGGRDSKDNARCCCDRCNSEKSDMTIREYVIYSLYKIFQTKRRYGIKEEMI